MPAGRYIGDWSLALAWGLTGCNFELAQGMPS